MNEKDYVYEVYKERSFSVAAKNLYVSQPALSASVKKVERELGITLFDRSTSPIVLTEEGKVYIEYLEKLRAIESETKNKLMDMSKLKTGKIVVSGENFVSSFIMPKVIIEFSKRYPGIHVELVESNSPDLRQLLITEAIDLLIAHDFDKKLYSSTPLFEETLLLAVPKDMPINKELKNFLLTREDVLNGVHLKDNCPKVSIKKFEDCPFILLKKGNDTRRRANEIFLEENFEPKTVKIYLDQLITSYNMVCFGLGVAFVNDILVKSSNQSGCVYYKLRGRATHRSMAIGYKKNKYLSKAIKAFIETAKDVYSNK
ncbi:MAG: LysR family transcriptional regulator [Clostridia bacterium]|nr:LysR family transcriptional regulator [Clostridia bacterium]